jgi:predicted  nucleic acid-binding Zn-ribbon protein
MSRLDAALARFSQTLNRLETAAQEKLARKREAAGLEAELRVVSEERDQLTARVASLEEEARALAGLTEEVEDRLDGAIAEIREVLGRN